MAYDDELGAVLDRMTHAELLELAKCIGLSDDEVSPHSSTLRQTCSKELRLAGGHSLVNLAREEHELPYRELVTDVAEFYKLKVEEDDDVLSLERKILGEVVRKMVAELDDTQLAELRDEIVKGTKTKQAAEALKRLPVGAVKQLIALTAAPNLLAGTSACGVTIGPVLSSVGNIVGWNVLQALVLQTVFQYVGWLAAAKAALGIGLWGGVMGVAGAAGPIGAVLGTAYTAHKIAGPAFRKTAPAVVLIAVKRIEHFAL